MKGLPRAPSPTSPTTNVNVSTEYNKGVNVTNSGNVFRAPDTAARQLFDEIANSTSMCRAAILANVQLLIRETSLCSGLIALFRQQVNAGFVIADPLSFDNANRKTFYDAETNVHFELQWNPFRELRHNHSELINRGIVASQIDHRRLVNRKRGGHACYLCKTNIDIQNPKEICLPIDLAGERFYAGANFAFITDNHFTVMSAEHRPQRYRKGVIDALNDFVDMTDGYFRGIFNGLAGASIKEHEHLQVTPHPFPVEGIDSGLADIIYSNSKVSVTHPHYYLPALLIEGSDKCAVNNVSDRLINGWLRLDEQSNTINIIATKDSSRNLFRTFAILRDRHKLAGRGKRGAMAAFESGGHIVLSCRPGMSSDNRTDERQTFANASLDTVKGMLMDISPADTRAVRDLVIAVLGS